METKPDPEVDKESLLGKSYSQKVALLYKICPKYGVKFIENPEGKHTVDANKTEVTRVCPKHGPHKVRLAAMTVRGNFGCHLCEHERRSEASRKSGTSQVKVTKCTERRVYLAQSECGQYIKVGATADDPVARLKSVNSACAKAGNDVVFRTFTFATMGANQSGIVEHFIKSMFKDYRQDDLKAFPGSGEIFKVTKVCTIRKMLASARHLNGREFSTPAGTTSFADSTVDFCEMETLTTKREELSARYANEIGPLLKEAARQVKLNFDSLVANYGTDNTLDFDISVVWPNYSSPAKSVISVSANGKSVETKLHCVVRDFPQITKLL